MKDTKKKYDINPTDGAGGMRVKRVCAIHDLSAFGRCALTVVIPTLSAMGVQVVPLPTAVMSTHTGGYNNIHILSLTDDMRGMYRHWLSLGVTFDAIYSGFVLDTEQGTIIGEMFDAFREKAPDTLILVDPVMGDDGTLYSTCTDEMSGMMRDLCRRADVITPNLTEACLLCGEPYPAAFPMKKEDADALLGTLFGKLLSLAPRAVITGIPVRDGNADLVGTAIMERGDVSHTDIFVPRVGAGYPGTGELFTSVLLGKLLSDVPFYEAAEAASLYTRDVIAYSETVGTPAREGVSLEPCLGKLTRDRAKENGEA